VLRKVRQKSQNKRVLVKEEKQPKKVQKDL